eukprot:CAMPEP_0197901806 /NCGR_PEP_ID=MMETSP1439-20131203/51949_1 /TAXON_ID=66791 /ORGANISM="Gonyaulax spinifera, Strain CCMP409" /LENGTH=84 /DNA_ID=CAMNT_0043522791 /DNA_START=77 /DNA_END=330 /DNA_ORIENTATION=-
MEHVGAQHASGTPVLRRGAWHPGGEAEAAAATQALRVSRSGAAVRRSIPAGPELIDPRQRAVPRVQTAPAVRVQRLATWQRSRG